MRKGNHSGKLGREGFEILFVFNSKRDFRAQSDY